MSPIVDGVSTLHSVWDSVGYQFTGYATLPFSAASWTDNGVTTAAMVTPYPVDVAKLNNGNFEEWATEGYTNSVNYVYKDFADGQNEVDQAYKTQAENISKSRIMYGGRRLANLMITIFGTAPATSYLQ